ncbi:MAG: MBL fold metallo-hydrolase [Candidatus Neomarinimicrobiota bacterium]|jgi:metallo-beta-lactamase family protein|nr:MBL fold metallo-hydrolase [Candidatus Neomarinimicrobiota bacterium]MDD3966214.1 MBL fold metallo-hydrolase [Candidatus Neomarinimicrobiota bacterium]
MASITFLGATGTVTGSKYLLQHANSRVLIDCGLFQGLKELRLRNWTDLKSVAQELDAILLTHAHIDHTGYLPRMVRQGFNKPVFCTEATRDLLEIMLLDSAHLQEEDAKYANKKGFSKHKPALPLYGIEDAQKAIALLQGIPYEQEFEAVPGIRTIFRDAGHILGSAFIRAEWQEETEKRSVLFSGDLGRPDRPILKNPALVKDADYLLIESTYGNRLHPEGDPKSEIKRIILETAQRGGVIVIPSFAVGRTQELLYRLRELEDENAIPVLPVYVDSPMAIKATKVYEKYPQIYDREATSLSRKGVDVMQTTKTIFTPEVEASKRINEQNEPCIIISASGMLTGGRILHHLIRRLPQKKNSIVFVGYQAEGTRGRALQEGKNEIKIHGMQIRSAARIETISDFSAHADYREILNWLGNFETAPRRTFIVHGEPEASENLALEIKKGLDWETHIPQYLEEIQL